jgi:hypothetical protein
MRFTPNDDRYSLPPLEESENDVRSATLVGLLMLASATLVGFAIGFLVGAW